jgi:hypothetical protein
MPWRWVTTHGVYITQPNPTKILSSSSSSAHPQEKIKTFLESFVSKTGNSSFRTSNRLSALKAILSPNSKMVEKKPGVYVSHLSLSLNFWLIFGELRSTGRSDEFRWPFVRCWLLIPCTYSAGQSPLSIQFIVKHSSANFYEQISASSVLLVMPPALFEKLLILFSDGTECTSMLLNY